MSDDLRCCDAGATPLLFIDPCDPLLELVRSVHADRGSPNEPGEPWKRRANRPSLFLDRCRWLHASGTASNKSLRRQCAPQRSLSLRYPPGFGDSTGVRGGGLSSGSRTPPYSTTHMRPGTSSGPVVTLLVVHEAVPLLACRTVAAQAQADRDRLPHGGRRPRSGAVHAPRLRIECRTRQSLSFSLCV
jgi:hypothetical protein